MNFCQVATQFSRIERESSRLKKTDLLAQILEPATSQEAAIIAYLALGSLHAVYKREKFNFAEKSMLSVVARLLNIPSLEVKKLAISSGDLGDVFEQKFINEPEKKLTVHEVNSLLLLFLRISGVGSQEGKEQALHDLLFKLEPLSAKYVIRIVLGRLRLGFSDMTLLDAFSWMVHGDKSIRKELENAYNISADIGKIVATLKDDGLEGIQKISITPGIPIRPAAAERLADAAAIIEKIGPCFAQSKLDGFRLQLHLDLSSEEKAIHFYSRNLQDMSAMFPELSSAVQDLPVKTLVVEGEAIAYDSHSDSFLPFQETVKRKRKHDIERVAASFPLRLYLFDILYLDGKSYLEVPQYERRKVLAQLMLTDKVRSAKVLFPVDEKEINTAQELEEYFNTTVAVGLEGLVVKRKDAPYQPGKRNFNWIKLKRQETGELDDTLDCVILGYYHGKGRRAGFGIGALLVGVYNETKSLFETVAKIGTGLKDNEWADIKEMLDDISVTHCPEDVSCNKDLFPDVWVLPKEVCIIRADEITRSPMHTAGLTSKEQGLALRFPRFMGYRNDKSGTDATTVSELKALFSIQFNKAKQPEKKEKSNLTQEVNLKIE